MKNKLFHKRQFFALRNEMKVSNLIKHVATILVTVMLCINVYAEEVLTNKLDLSCNQSDSYILACSYRPFQQDRIADLTASMDGNPIEISKKISYPAFNSVTAILFLVDTSDPGRQDVITKNASQIEQMLNAVESHHIFGLANFDKELNFRVPFGKDKSSVVSAANALQASGLTTELYRNIIRAIELLGRTKADRKVLFLFSDGQAEDKAYFHEDVIRVARRNGVVINSIGFPRSTPLSVALQTLRRLSEETAGIYIEADAEFKLPTSFISKPYSNIDRGGHFKIDLAKLGESSKDDPRIELKVETVNGAIPVMVPARLMRPEIPVVQPALILPPVLPMQPQPAFPAQGSEPGYIDFLLWYGMPIALLVLIILTLITVYLVFRKQQTDDTSNKISYAEIKPLAYLITQDEKGKSYPVTSNLWRIGRSQDNEMTITDNSISRRHAELQRESDGQFVVYDRGSTNGVFVNNQKITKHRLNEGDIIEMGDVFLRFTQNPLDYQLAEDTSMIHTRAPDII